MLRYAKGTPPQCLTILGATPNATWDHVYGDQKAEIRTLLVRDQAGLCAYCQRRITVTGTMKVEHWYARSLGGPHFQWSNLLGTCDGIAPGIPPRTYGRFSGSPESQHHCDTERGNVTLYLHPVVGLGHDPQKYLRYKGDGRISATMDKAEQDLSTLNLNATYLRRGRAMALEALKQRIDGKGWSLGTLRAEFKALEPKSGTTAPEHAEFLRYHLQKWIQKKTSGA
jgi:uncharacterized protein (TIGR02646 family)